MRQTAFFAGSFDPFTLGHKAIVERAVRLFGHVTIGVGYNMLKHGSESASQRVAAIKEIFAGRDDVYVEAYTGLTAQEALRLRAQCLVRGVRDTRDYEYERGIAEVNRRLFGVETVLLCADAELGFLSSSVVRELASHGYDVSALLP